MKATASSAVADTANSGANFFDTAQSRFTTMARPVLPELLALLELPARRVLPELLARPGHRTFSEQGFRLQHSHRIGDTRSLQLEALLHISDKQGLILSAV